MAKGRPARQRRVPTIISKEEKAVRDLINTLRIDQGWTIDEILERLHDMGKTHIKRSTLGRHIRTIEDMVEEIRETDIYAEALARQAGNLNQSEMLDLNGQLLQANIFKLFLAEKDGEGVKLSSKETMEISSALRNTAQARKLDLEVIDKAEERGAKKERAALKAKLEKDGKAGGLDPEALERAKRIMGFD